MKTLTFHTNIRCGGCVAKVTPHLNALEGVEGNWQVDIQNPGKVLSVNTNTVSARQIKDAVQQAGFTIEQV